MKTKARTAIAICLTWLGAASIGAAHQEAQEASSGAEAAATPEQQLAELKAGHGQEMRAFYDKLRGAQSEQEQQRIFTEEAPDLDAWVARFRALIDANPGTDVALQSLLWIFQEGEPSNADAALREIARDFVDSPALTPICMSFDRYSPTRSAQGFLTAVLEKSPHGEARAAAAYGLAQVLLGAAGAAREPEGSELIAYLVQRCGAERVAELRAMDPEELTTRAEGLLVRVAEGEIEGAPEGIVAMAAGDVFELRNLAVGKVAPEIEAEDVDGVTFKLSDYRGQVVLLDFWGHW